MDYRGLFFLLMYVYISKIPQTFTSETKEEANNITWS